MKPSEKTRIFIVDDHPLIRNGISHAVEEDPSYMVCGEAEDVEHAVQGIETHHPDLVIADLSLEHSSGLDLIEYLNRRNDRIPVLVISMHDEPAYIERAFQAGARGYLLKRESMQKVAQAIRQILKGRIYTSETVSENMFETFNMQRGHDTIDPKDVLSKREYEVFQLLGEGESRGDISLKLNISSKTVDSHMERIKTKLNVHSSVKLTHLAFKHVLETK